MYLLIVIYWLFYFVRMSKSISFHVIKQLFACKNSANMLQNIISASFGNIFEALEHRECSLRTKLMKPINNENEAQEQEE